jgi:hypothetical protein
VGLVGFAALVLGVTGLVWLRRARRKPAEEPELAPVATRTVVRVEQASPAAEPRSALGALMLCPTCRAEYAGDSRFCKFDGNRLVGVGREAESRGPAGGICPVCEQGYDPGVASCPVHDEDLVPARAAPREERPSGQYPKICPTCGIQYPGGSGFCDADGSALVTVN